MCSLCGLPALANPATPDPDLRAFLERTINDASSFADRFEAEVWLIDMEHRLKPLVANRAQRFNILRTAHQEAHRMELPPELILALIEVESAFDRFAVSRAGAQGLMQVMPFWKQEIGRPADNLTQVETNLRYGTAILAHYLKRENGNLHRALARYNGSLGKNWYPQRVFTTWRRRWYTGDLAIQTGAVTAGN
ncbi:MAG: lytic transglycosylase domain-containing protein [Pseudomonadota bacterium]|nr:lytic transglycosylase domain-containing protein [Pseudomonadota bacterium]